MARLSRIERESANQAAVLAPSLEESEHFHVCAGCGQLVDRRNLGDVFHHEEPGHEPLPAPAPRLKFIPPMLPTLSDEPPEGNGWLHEIKYDGYRTQICIEQDHVRAYTRNGFDWSERYLPVVEAARQLSCDSAIIDGEVIIQDEQGRCDFHRLRQSIDSRSHDLVLIAFDLMHLNGEDLRTAPLEVRRARLEEMLGPNDPTFPIHFSEAVRGDGDALFKAADAMGLEGIVSKKLGSRYRSGHQKAWLKTKCFTEEEFVVIGTERGDKAPVALLARETDGKLEYAGGAMVTLRQPERDRFWQQAEELETRSPPLPMKPRKKASWTRPSMRVRVRTLRGEKMLRHATISGLVEGSGW
jgi:bifunctional non-homologous end joining protein LigD